ncbi:2-hydroxyacid dehydrogenase [Ovoidimarina sediminis]|uniref:2-hydroxyacid dehydrogenase n=1 Tax=Ovoidimarina sediminis TaxID=3079856 RepID=UPI002909607B|nr:glyoxylate/hydroxypyruvate reductase A [Rhodophyticola sp. MJ-SS7]MDU8943434.1 glyoxylate/hydroxypyruvate reductase A [Rhodophyticola sp. MJ-SS7]
MTEIVCLSADFDLKTAFEDAFAEALPAHPLRRPDEIADPASVRVAFAHAPPDNAFDPYPDLALVCSWGAGVDRLVDHPGLRPETTLCRMVDPGQADMMAAFAAHYVTGWHRGMFRYPAQQAERRWELVNWTANAEVPVGLLGFGNMGAATGRALRALGYPVAAWAGRARHEDGVEVLAGEDGLFRLLGQSRVVVACLPLTPATDGILNARTLGAMRDDALLVQLGRGRHLVEEDLIPALDAGRPAAAALDVFRTEPLPSDHPFWADPRIMITPHAASSSTDLAVAQAVGRAIADLEAGRSPAGAVDRTRGY